MMRSLPHRFVRDVLPPAILLSVCIIVWWVYARLAGLSAFILPTPVDVLSALFRTRTALVDAIAITLLETAVGLIIALIFAVVIAAVMDTSPILRRALYPLLITSQTVQILALAPLLIIWFKFGLTSKVIIVMIVCFFPMAVSTFDGLTSADPDYIALMRSMGASRSQIWRIVRLPAAMPAFFSGLRVAVTYSIVGATIAEWVGGEGGLGLYMLRSKNALATDQVFAGMLVTTLLSITLFVFVSLIERAALPWYYSTQRAEQWEETGIY